MKNRSIARRAVVAIATLVTAASLAACGSDGSPAPKTPTGKAAEPCRQSAPEETRLVDTAKPVFTNPTKITHPLFPITAVPQVVQLGVDAGEKLRHEITLLPGTKNVEWDGQSIEAIVSQFTATLDGRIVENAVDFFAQDDAGNVWYLGEDVVNYENGVVKDTEGTWLAGRDGPAGLIMPSKPQVGDQYRPENIPGLVEEKVTVLASDQTLVGPSREVTGGLCILEELMDGTKEIKAFAPGYGEFLFRTDDELGTVAVAAPTDTRSGAPVPEVAIVADFGVAAFDTAAGETWEAAKASVRGARIASKRAKAATLVLRTLNGELTALDQAVKARDALATRRAALDVILSAIDLELQQRPGTSVETARMATWARRVQVDVEANDPAGVRSDTVLLESIWARASHAVDAALAATVDSDLAALRTAADAQDLAAAEVAAKHLLGRLI